MIMFHTEEKIVKEIFNIIDKELYEKEKEEFPFHYDISFPYHLQVDHSLVDLILYY